MMPVTGTWDRRRQRTLTGRRTPVWPALLAARPAFLLKQTVAPRV